MNLMTVGWRRKRLTASLLLLVAGSLAGCDLLEVSDPTALEESELSDAAGAQMLRGGALQALSIAVANAAFFGGLLADEFFAEPPPSAAPGTWAEEVLDRRESVNYEQRGADGGYTLWQEVRRAVAVALPMLRSYAVPGAREAHVGEMMAVGAFATLRLAEDFCPGFPLHTIVDYKVVLGPPLSTEEALARALADFESAVHSAADSARILNLARVGRSRTLLNLGHFAEAGSAAAAVPTGYVYQAEYNSTFSPWQPNVLAIDGFEWVSLRRSVSDHEGGTGLDFVSANDPRVQTTFLGTARDGVTRMYGISKYPSMGTPIVLASGVEARLIEAEAALRAGAQNWLTILNELRATQVSPALDPLPDPGTQAAQVDLLFRERAFWLFATGHRLGDLRRLIRQYGRESEDVFPTGDYRLGGAYETATAIPFPAVREQPHNPAVTGCTSR